MRYDLSTRVTDLNNVQISDEIDREGYTLRSVLVRAALFVDRGKNPTAPEKLASYGLAKRIATSSSLIDLPAEDVSHLKERIGVMFTPLVMGRVWEILEAPLTKPLAEEETALGTNGDHRGARLEQQKLASRKPAADIPPKA